MHPEMHKESNISLTSFHASIKANGLTGQLDTIYSVYKDVKMANFIGEKEMFTACFLPLYSIEG